MSKEQRIGIINLKEQCEHCRVMSEEFDGIYPDCKDCPIFTKTMLRSKAVERMTWAISKELKPCLKPFDKVPKEKRGCVRTAAEAALDALLKTKN